MLSSLLLRVLWRPLQSYSACLVGGIRREYRGVSCLLHTWMVISLELLQQYKVDTEILVPVLGGDTWAFYKPW